MAFHDFGKWTGDSVGCQAGVSPCCDSPSSSEEGGLYFLSSRRSSEVALIRGCCPGCRSQRPGRPFRSAYGRGICPDTGINRHCGHLGSQHRFEWWAMPSKGPSLAFCEEGALCSLCLNLSMCLSSQMEFWFIQH